MPSVICSAKTENIVKRLEIITTDLFKLGDLAVESIVERIFKQADIQLIRFIGLYNVNRCLRSFVLQCGRFLLYGCGTFLHHIIKLTFLLLLSAAVFLLVKNTAVYPFKNKRLYLGLLPVFSLLSCADGSLLLSASCLTGAKCRS